MPSIGDPVDEARDEVRDGAAQEETQDEIHDKAHIQEQPPKEPNQETHTDESTQEAQQDDAPAAKDTATIDSSKRPPTEDPAEDALAQAADDTSTDTPPAKRRALCGVCELEPSKYKCSRCLLRYCSVACSRKHQENHPPDEPKEEKPTAPAEPRPQPAPKVTHPFQVLDNAPELQRLFKEYPRLPARLRTIHDATLPPKNTSNSPFPSRGGRGGRGGGRGGRGGGFGKPAQPWTKEIGLLQGQKALRRARVDPTEDGDAVRAYCEVVTYLLSKGATDAANAASAADAAAATAAANTANNAAAIVRAEIEAEGTQVIKQLLDAEGRQ